MTLIVGIRCRDGVVVATDSAATYAASGDPTIGQQHVTKLVRIGKVALFGATGAVGISQIVADSLESRVMEVQKNSHSSAETMQVISKDIHDRLQHLFHSAAMLGQAGMRHAFLDVSCKFLVAMPVRGDACLFQFAETGAPEQATADLPCVALGSGQKIADPFLALLRRLLWSDHEPNVAEARLVAAWTIDHVKRTNPGGVGGELQMATLSIRGNQAKIESCDDAEHTQYVEEMEKSLRDVILGRVAPRDVSEVPQAPA